VPGVATLGQQVAINEREAITPQTRVSIAARRDVLMDRSVTRSALRAPRPAARLREPDRPSPHSLDELLDSSSSAPRP